MFNEFLGLFDDSNRWYLNEKLFAPPWQCENTCRWDLFPYGFSSSDVPCAVRVLDLELTAPKIKCFAPLNNALT